MTTATDYIRSAITNLKRLRDDDLRVNLVQDARLGNAIIECQESLRMLTAVRVDVLQAMREVGE